MMTIQQPIHARLTRWLALLFLSLCATAFSAPRPWEQPYSSKEAQEEEATLALWTFDPKDPARDASGKGHDLKLSGDRASFVADGKFGGALRIAEGEGPGNTPQGAMVNGGKPMAGDGSLTSELWIAPEPGLHLSQRAYLLDNKFLHQSQEKNHRGFMLYLMQEKTQEKRFRLVAELGFGDHTEVIQSPFHDFPAGEWQHIALSYEAETGNWRFYFNGRESGSGTLEKAQPLLFGRRALVIGDRAGSNYQPFTGRISQVRLSGTALAFRPPERLHLDLGLSRTAFGRMEKEAALAAVVTNETDATLKGAKLRVSGAGEPFEVAMPELAPGARREVALPVNTALRSGSYPVEVALVDRNDQVTGERVHLTLTLVPRPLPHRMPVILWSAIPRAEAEQVREIGFTHLFAIVQYSSSPSVDFIKEEKIPAMRDWLDSLYAKGLLGIATIRGSSLDKKMSDSLLRRKRNGELYPQKGRAVHLNGLHPEVQQTFYDCGAFIAKNFGDLPGLAAALVATETRDHTRPSFSEIDRNAYRAATGREIPGEVAENAWGVSYRKLKDIQADRIVPDDQPVVDYFRWFWKVGDGWNGLYTSLVKGLHSTGRDDLWTWFDPAVRTPSIWGSGGEVDALNQWTYTYPDPLKISLACDELAAMGDGNPRQKIMNMTQIIWYRSGTAPEPREGDAKAPPRAAWEIEQPDARFITIAPDHLSEAFWLELSHPIAGILYHGWGSLADYTTGGYRGTNPETRERLKKLIETVVQPLGPTLRQVPDAPANVAILSSFTSQILAGRGTRGYGRGWGTDAYLIVRYAGLQPRMLYEEHLLRDGLKGLEGIELLFLPHCDLLPRSVADVITAFQDRGGIVIGDEFLAPGIEPDLLLTSFQRSRKADEDKATLLSKAGELVAELNGFYDFPVQSNQPEMIVRRRGVPGAEVLFLINDARKFGDYVGHHGLVQEEGMSLEATVDVRHAGNPALYNLLLSQPVPLTRKGNDRVSFPIRLGGGEGAVLLLLDEPVGRLTLECDPTASLPGPFTVKARLNGESGDRLKAVVPFYVSITDPQGREAEGSGFYGGSSGELAITLDLARNDLPGEWTVTFREGVSGQSVARRFQVKPLSPP
ncbi:MAG TPA: LamG domain-containing protein [Chthoniobacteraceae bacterium]|nr:LamG domain-containing protein [Chthoniobacteraceae bacterium]